MAENKRLTEEEVEQGCSAYIPHWGLGCYCVLKPTLKRYGRIYCTLHDPVRLKAIGDKRAAEFIDNLHKAEKFRKDSAERLRREGYSEAIAKIRELVEGAKLTDRDIESTEDTFIEDAKAKDRELSKLFIDGDITYSEYEKKSQLYWTGCYRRIAQSQLQKVKDAIDKD